MINGKYGEVGFIAEADYDSNTDNTAWLFDTAASFHFCLHKDFFVDFEPISGMK